MAFWHRINHLKLKVVSHQLRRGYVQTPCASFLSYTSINSRSCALENPIWDIFQRSTDICNNTRFFATSFQAKARKEEKGANGPRLNNEITARFVRLVTDDGHCVVSLNEARERARKLQLDLVEVQGKVDPPVCKIMDFHREQYKRKVKEKERAKEKKDVTLKKGDCKEVRFLEKTEQKDLKIKADTVIRMMERGYRVKCMALGSPKKGGRASMKKGSEDEGLTEEEIAEMRRQEEEEKERLRTLLSRLTAMLGDEFIVESGPMVEKKQAYVIVRHAKFGPTKKRGAKKTKDIGKVTISQTTANNSGPIRSAATVEEDIAESGMETEDEILPEDDESAWSVADSADDIDGIFDFNNDAKAPILKGMEMLNIPREVKSSQMNLNIANGSQQRPVHDFNQSDRIPSSPQPSGATENRYRRSTRRESFPPTSSRDSRGPDRMESFRNTLPQFSNQSGFPQSEVNVAPTIGERKPNQLDSSPLRTAEMHKQPSPSGAPSTKTPSYGIFSSTKASPPGKQGGTSEVNNNSEGKPHSLGRNSNAGANSKSEGVQRPRDDDGNGQARWGIFSKDGPNVNPNRISKGNSYND